MDAADCRSLFDAFQADQRAQWIAGKRLLVEAYLEKEPRVSGNAEVMLDLIYHEFCLREEFGCQVEQHDYFRRFPELKDTLRDLFEVHWALARSGQWPTINGEGPGGERLSGADPLQQPLDSAARSVGPYVLLARLGEGGMGTVYMAEQHAPLHRRVALKIIRPGMDSREVIARFEAERQALAMMDHPNIARALDAGTTSEGLPYFVMDLIEGAPITRFCDERQLTLRERLALFLPICHGIQHAHHKGIVHRDIKPTNVLVALDDGQPVPKVIDFGLAKAMQQRLTEKSLFTQFGQLLGTIEYMSPEQAGLNQLDIDTRSDVYSLGVLLYELITGTTPLNRERIGRLPYTEVLRLVREDVTSRPSKRISELRGTVSRPSTGGADGPELMCSLRSELDWIVMKALEKDRSRRYDSPGALAADIERYLNNEPVEARPQSAMYRLRKFASRNKRLVGAAAVVAVALLAATAVSTWQAFVAWEAREKIQRSFERESDALAASESARSAERLTAAKLRSSLLETDFALRSNQLERAVHSCRVGEYAEGVTRLVQVYDSSPAGDPLRLGALNLIAGWSEFLPVAHLRHSHPAAARDVAFSPDGRLLASGGADKTVRLWNAANGAPLGELAHDGFITRMAFSPDGRWLATTGSDRLVRQWNVEDRSLRTLPIDIEDTARGLVYSLDGERLLALVLAGKLAVIDAATGDHRFVDLDCNQALSLDISPDGARLAVAAGFEARLFDAKSFTQIGAPLRHANYVHALAFDNTGARLATAVADGTAHLWSLETGTSSALPVADQIGRMLEVDFSPDGKLLVTGGADGTLRVWEIDPAPNLAHAFQHGGMVSAVKFSPDGSAVATGSHDLSGGRLWLLPRPADTYHVPTGGIVTDVSLSKDGRFVAASSLGVVYSWHAADQRRRYRSKGTARSSTWAMSPDGRFIAESRLDGQVEIFFAETGEAHWGPIALNSQRNALAFSTSSDLLAAGDTTGCVHVWETATGRRVCELCMENTPIHRMAFAPNGRFLAATGNNRLWVWACDSWALAAEHPLSSMVATGVEFSPDSRSLAVMLVDCFQIFETDSGRPRGAPVMHSSRAFCGQFSPDGRHFAMAGDDSVGVWQVDDLQQPPLVLRHDNFVQSLAFRPDGRVLFTAGNDKILRSWDVATGQWFGPPRRVDHGNFSVACSGDGQFVYGVRDNAICRYPIAQPLADEPERIRAWIEIRTGLTYSADGGVRVLDVRDWRQRWQQLDALGGPPAMARAHD